MAERDLDREMMQTDVKYFKCVCAHCGGRIEYPVEAVGTTVDCPHCGEATDLVLPEPAESSSDPSKIGVWVVVGIVVLLIGVAGVAGAFYMLHRVARHRAALQAPPASTTNAPTQTFVTNELSVGTINLERANSLIYAAGTVRNEANRRRFGVKVELELGDDTGAAIAKGSDYTPAIEPRAQWTFRALVLDKRASQARVTALTEEK